MNEAFSGDLVILWQSQNAEHATPSENEIRTRVKQLEAKVQRNLILTFVIGLVLLISCAISAMRLHYTIPRLIAAAMIVPISASIYQTVKRIRSPRSTAQEGSASACLEFYREHLLDHYRAIKLRWQLTVPTTVFLWFAVTFIGRSFLILRVMFPALLVLIFFVRRWELRKINRDIAGLEAFANEGSTDL